MSAGERRRLAQKARLVDLLDQEVRHVGSGDEPGSPVARIDQDTIAPRPWSVHQNGWTNDRPVEPTTADDAFLHILVGVNLAAICASNPQRAPVPSAARSARPRDRSGLCNESVDKPDYDDSD